MPTFTEPQMRARGAALEKSMRKTASAALAESARAADAETFDIFLSHSMLDETTILGTHGELEQTFGYNTYVDWITDPELDRSKVTAQTAHKLRQRMRNSGVLLYAHSTNAVTSRWMPWECGYFDGLKARCAILPLTPTPQEDYKGSEYLGIYPYIKFQKMKDGGDKLYLWVHEAPDVYCLFNDWTKGQNPRKH